MTPLQRIRLGTVILGLVFVLSVIGYRLAGRAWLDAVYMVVITIGTVGNGEDSKLGSGEQVLTISVILIGVTAAAFLFGAFLQLITEGEIRRAMQTDRSSRSVDKLHDHVIICGFGRVGRILAEELQRRKQSVVVVDHHNSAVHDAHNAHYVSINGDATEESVLRQAGVERAKCLVSALPSDAANVFITITSRNLNPKLRIIARGETPSTEKKLLQAGADRVVLPAATGALRMASMITHPSTVEFMELVAGQSVLDVELDELLIGPTSSLVGKTIQDAETRRRHKLLVVAVKKAAGAMVFNLDSDLVFQQGDTLIVMGKIDDIERFRQEYHL